MTPNQELMIRRLRAMDLNTCNEAADLIESMAKRVPLSDAEIEALNCIELDRECYEIFSVRQSSVIEFARAVEAAHGIRSEK